MTLQKARAPPMATCDRCGRDFASRNKLFKHLKNPLGCAEADGPAAPAATMHMHTALASMGTIGVPPMMENPAIAPDHLFWEHSKVEKSPIAWELLSDTSAEPSLASED